MRAGYPLHVQSVQRLSFVYRLSTCLFRFGEVLICFTNVLLAWVQCCSFEFAEMLVSLQQGVYLSHERASRLGAVLFFRICRHSRFAITQLTKVLVSLRRRAYLFHERASRLGAVLFFRLRRNARFASARCMLFDECVFA